METSKANISINNSIDMLKELSNDLFNNVRVNASKYSYSERLQELNKYDEVELAIKLLIRVSNKDYNYLYIDK
jgi:hypothetical protein